MDAVASVKRQTYTNWEIIIVDDQSTDNSEELYGQLKSDARIKVFFNEHNGGCGFTKRRCAELANGELCAFLDPDDALTDNALQVMAEQHQKYPSASLIYSKCYHCNEDLSVRNISTNQQTIPQGETLLTCKNHAAIDHFATWKRASYRQTNGLNPSFLRAVDQDLYFLLEEVGDAVFVDRPLYYYRFQSQSISLGHNENKALYWHIKAMEDACQRRNLNPEEVIGNFLSDIQQEKDIRICALKSEIRHPISAYCVRIKKKLCRLFSKK